MKDWQITIMIFIIAVFMSCNNKEVQKDYYEDGQLRGELQVNSAGKPDGYFKHYYQDGTLKELCHYSDGEKEGVLKEFYNNGQLKIITNYKNGKRHGMYKEFFKNGQQKKILNWVNGKPKGKFKSYHKNGQISMDALLNNDTTLYYKKYDSMGVLVDIFREIRVEGLKETYALSDTLKVTYQVTGPKNWDSLFIEVGIGGSRDHYWTYAKEANNGKVNFTYVPDSTGSYVLVGHLKEYDEDTSFSFIYNYFEDFTVIDTTSEPT